jgi:hypothetical protein
VAQHLVVQAFLDKVIMVVTGTVLVAVAVAVLVVAAVAMAEVLAEQA